MTPNDRAKPLAPEPTRRPTALPQSDLSGLVMPLRVTVEIIPHGDESRKSKLAVVEIVNDGTGTKELGNYRMRAEGEVVGGWDLFAVGELKGFRRERGYMACVSECLKNMPDDEA